MAAMSGGTQPHGHLLYDDRHAECQNHEGNEESDSKSCARRRVGNHAGAVVLSKHHENSRSNEQPQETEFGEGPSLGARRRNPDTVVCTIDVLMGDYNIFLGDGLWRYPDAGPASISGSLTVSNS